MGHLIRCKAIEEEFSRAGAETVFYLDSNTRYDHKYPGIRYFEWQKIEIDQYYDVVFIDSFEATVDTYSYIGKYARLLVCIDDFSRLLYPDSLIINFSSSFEDKFYENYLSYRPLLGLDYVPIRNCFHGIKSISDNSKRIFIMLGGHDTAFISEAIAGLLEKDVLKFVVTGDPEAKVRLSAIPNTVVLYKPSDNELIANMSMCDFAITTASMSAYELNFLNIPSVILSVSENQHSGAWQLIENKISNGYVSTLDIDWEIKLKAQVDTFFYGGDINQVKVIDGFGTRRIVTSTMEILNDE